jgi:hypothetical protein
VSQVDRESFLLITLDSCRYDTYVAAKTPNLDKIGSVHKAYAPGNFTLPSHIAMFSGFTPGDPKSEIDYVNPKVKRVWKLGKEAQGSLNHLLILPGTNIVDGFNKSGYVTIGTGGVGWFKPSEIASAVLIEKFEHYNYFGNYFYLRKQVEWLKSKVLENQNRRKFIFLNIGETHSPYWHEGAEWDPDPCPCVPFGKDNDREKSQYRQRKCLEYIDSFLGEFLTIVNDFNILICGDHGDAWGEDDIWEHAIHHEKVHEVPLIIKVNNGVDYSFINNNREKAPLLKRVERNFRKKILYRYIKDKN